MMLADFGVEFGGGLGALLSDNLAASAIIRWGYRGQAQLSRQDRSRYGRSPSEARATYCATAR
ncbi:hypothetical protein BRAO375_1030011 [Bradyrhizobium sp. ORS 375]|nr:hypothetical protein BRAO375_1030011 [Bradyrhizobium sp. ORS 375]